MIQKSIFALLILLYTSSIVQLPSVSSSPAATPFWQANVPGSGESIESPVLVEGQVYLIIVNGTFYYNFPSGFAADAQYYAACGSDPTNWASGYPAPDGHSFLQINGEDIDWGPFSNGDTGHIYSTDFTGEGASRRAPPENQTRDF